MRLSDAFRSLLCSSLLIAQAAVAQELMRYQYVFPRPNSQHVSKETNIIVRPGKNIDPTCLLNSSLFVVTGTKSGFHKGEAILTDDHKTVVFNPSEPFVDDERVSVVVSDGLKEQNGTSVSGMSFEFSTAVAMVLSDVIEPAKAPPGTSMGVATRGHESIVATGDTLPADFPSIRIDTLNNPAPGEIFLANFGTPGAPLPLGNYVMILDNSGKPLAYKKIGSQMNAIAYVFKAESNGLFSYIERTPATGTTIRLLDTSMSVVDSYPNPSPSTLIHADFVLLPNGHALVLYFDAKIIDMSKIVRGGNPVASVTGALVQEFDINKNVVFQWSSFDYLPITDTYGDTLASAISYTHTNSVEPDNDGNILLSNRAISEIIKIDRNTGDVIWRLGGKRNQFIFLNEHSENSPLYFTNQHDIKRLPNGNVTLFDNGNQHKPQYSRAVEYRLDELNKTATLVWEYRHTPDLYASANGSVQRLPNGNTVIGWGDVGLNGKTSITEVHSDNSVAFELTLSKGYRSMKAFRFPWRTGTPAAMHTLYELLQGNTYSFDDTSATIRTGVRMKFNVLTPFFYNRVSVQRFATAPSKPRFAGRSPWMAPHRVTISQQGMLTVNADVFFDVTQFPGHPDPNLLTVYQRDSIGSGVFAPLQTSYNSVRNEIVANTSKFGEFIFCWDDSASSANSPIMLYPLDRDSVNQRLPVRFNWNPRGYVIGYHLQVAADSLFKSLVLNDSLLIAPLATLQTVAATATYYWRIRARNYAQTSNWSPVWSFTTTMPYVSVSLPNGKEVWLRGYEYFIKWLSNIKDRVRIDLFRGTSRLSTIKDSVPNLGAYAWTIPSSTAPDTAYKIKITSVADSSLFGISSSSFTIRSASTEVDELNQVPREFALYQNYPNPFNPTTNFGFRLSNFGFVTLQVFDVLGREVATLANEVRDPGMYTVRWDASALPTGVYLYRLRAGEFVETRKMTLIK